MRGQISALRPGKEVAARVVAVAEVQWGVLARRQLLTAGLSSNEIDRWVTSGRLHRIGRGVYALGHRALPLEGRLTAALFEAGSGAALSHWSALHWWGLQRLPPDEIHIASMHRPGGAQGVVIHRPRELLAVYHRRLPVTSVSRALVDIAPATPVKDLRRLLAEAEYQRLLELKEFERELRRGRRGSARIRAALARHQPLLAAAQPGLEEAFLALVETAGLPLPELNARVSRMRVDALWREQKVAVELDGTAGHGTRAQIDRDHRRDLHLRSLGYVVLRYSYDQVTLNPDVVIADLSRALFRAGAAAA